MHAIIFILALSEFFGVSCRKLNGDARLWRDASTFLGAVPLKYGDNEIFPLLGFRWGYGEYDNLDRRSASLVPLEVTGAYSWNKLLPLLRNRFPGWHFVAAS
jgi:hypothetical protein